MNKRLYYLNLLSLLNEAAEELNILDLQERETVLLSHIWKLTSEGKNNYTADYSEFSEHSHSEDLGDDDLCKYARSRDVQQILVLHNFTLPLRYRILGC